MKIFLASFSTRVPEDDRPLYQGFLRRHKLRVRELLSYLDADRAWNSVYKMRGTRRELMIDSGAYSAWTQNKEISLEKYAAFILSHVKAIDSVVNLDVIPGRWGEIPGQKEIDISAERGWENWEELSKMLAPIYRHPMHVFHQGENFRWLHRLMDHAEYLGISPGNDRSPGQKRAWLDEVWQHLCDKQGCPIRKTHGFGVTSLDLITRFPWTSCDSLTWLLAGRYGHLCIPIGPTLAQIAVSTHETAAHHGRHIRAFSPPERAAIRHWARRRGFSIEKLARQPKQRDLFNILAFCELEQAGGRNYVKPATQMTVF